MDKKDFCNDYLGGIFAVIAAIAAVFEMSLGGFSVEAIVACIKDIFSMLAVVVVFFFILKYEWPFKSFRKKLEHAMKSVEASYAPLLREHKAKKENTADAAANQKFIRYDLARKVSALYGEQCNDYMRFLELPAEKPEGIAFFVRQKFFGEGFNPESIAKHTKSYLDKKHNSLNVTYHLDKDGARIDVLFDCALRSQKDIDQLLAIIDDVLFVFIAENKA